MKWLIVILVVLLLGLQFRLWVGEGSLAQGSQLAREIEHYRQENDTLKERNRLLALEVAALKSGTDAIEERAREQMGMVKEGETFYMIIDPNAQSSIQTP